MRTAKLTFVCIVTIVFVLAVVAGIFLAEGALHPGRRPLLALDQRQAREMANSNASDLTDVSIPAIDGVVLRAWNFRPRKNFANAVILSHGLSDNRAGMMAYAQFFMRHGYDVLMPDARAHGVSGGEIATYGIREENDLHRWLDWLDLNEHPACIYGFAESMGAAGLLQSLQSESRFCAVAAESPFSTFREIAYDRVGQFFHTGAWLGGTVFRPVVECAFIYAKWRYHLNFDLESPEKAVESTKVPALLIHGQLDRNIPVRHSRKIAAGNRDVVLWEVPGADHCGAIGIAPIELERRVIDWFQQNGRGTSRGQDSDVAR
jgi:alpha-beta hydrolase superfamily lysophospholipase